MNLFLIIIFIKLSNIRQITEYKRVNLPHSLLLILFVKLKAVTNNNFHYQLIWNKCISRLCHFKMMNQTGSSINQSNFISKSRPI